MADGSESVKRKLEELERKRLKQKECETKAVRVVERLLDNPVSRDFLQEALQFLSPSHYNDVTVERALDKLCGYPLCTETITVQLNQKYKIDTRNKKVYDVTERKNFCSNGCFKASKFLEAQVSKLPVWARDGEAKVVFEFMNPGGRKGLAGDLVVQSPSVALSSELDRISLVDECLARDVPTNQNEDELPEDKQRKLMEHSKSAELKKESINMELLDSDDDNDNEPKNTEENVQGDDEQKSLSNDQLNSQGDDEQSGKIARLMELLDRREKLMKEMRSKTDVQEKQVLIETEKNEDKNKSLTKDNNLICDDVCVTSSVKQVKTNVISLSSREKVEKFLSEWLADPSTANTDSVEDVKDRLDSKLTKREIMDSIVDSEKSDIPTGKVPDYDKLILEHEEFDVKVRQFYSGGKSTQTKKVEFSTDAAIEDDSDWTPTLPLIDSQSQKRIRHRIVFEALTNSLPSLLRLLCLRNDDVVASMKTLVRGANLTSANIVLKHNEWTLMSVYILKYLSLSDDVVSEAFTSHFNDVDDVICVHGVRCSDIDDYLKKISSSIVKN